MVEAGTADGGVMIGVRGLEVRFGLHQGMAGALARGPRFVKAVDGVSLDVRRGEVLGLVGESGSGKTTLGKTILRLYEPTAGRITFEGQDITHMSSAKMKPLRRNLQMVFQDPLSSLNPRHTVRTALATPLLIHHLCPQPEIEDRVDEILSQTGLPPVFKDRYPHELSGGQIQRVAIGRALTMSPALIVADEAVSKLDVSVRAQILNLFKDLQDRLGTTIVFITHDLRVARYLCHRIGVMYFGKLLELAPAETLFAAPRHPYTRALLGTLTEEEGEADAAGRPALAAEALNPTGETVGCRYRQRCPLRRPRCAERHPPLESIGPEHRIACFEWERG